MASIGPLVNFIKEVANLKQMDTLEVRKGGSSYVQNSVDEMVFNSFVLDMPSLGLVD